MSGKFIPAAEADREQLDWGALAWLSRPATTGAKDLVVIEVSLSPGGGHNFHKHPEQEEVIYVIEGTVEQWLRDEKRTLSSGDSVFIPADVVHAFVQYLLRFREAACDLGSLCQRRRLSTGRGPRRSTVEYPTLKLSQF